MSKPRVTTDEQDREIAEWYSNLKRMGTVQAKARELGISVCAVYDAISRGNGQPTAAERFKLTQYQAERVAQQMADNECLTSNPHNVSRESIESVLIED